MNKHFIISLLIFCRLFVNAQINLPNFLGLSNLPNDSDTICYFQPYLGDFDSSGLAIGDTAIDFTLYDKNGLAHNLENMLNQNKPVLLISGSLTCPVFRNKIADINTIDSIYAGLIEIFVIFTIEAHPTDISPYSGTIWITNQNQNAGILFPQPVTYGERKALADTLSNYFNLNAKILFDGTCNEWLSTYGPAPNNAYLIDTNGLIFEKQEWFNKLPDDIFCEIDSLLGIQSNNCNVASNNGSFIFNYVNDTIAYGVEGQTLAVKADIINQSSTDNAVVEIIRLNSNVPQNWLTALCIDVCYGTNVDTVLVIIPPSGTKEFTFYFYTDPFASGTGYATVGFRNKNISQNKFLRRFWGSTEKTTNNTEKINNDDLFISIYPNPNNGFFSIVNHLNESFDYTIVNNQGKNIISGKVNSSQNTLLDCSELTSGFYNISIRNEKRIMTKKIIIN